jgi:acetyl-CoA acetyltransferase family protein
MTMFKRPKTLGGKIKLLKKMRLRDFVIPERPALGEYSTGLIMGENADRLTRRLSISREDQDRYAERSHTLALTAMKTGKFRNEIVPVVLPNRETAIVDDNGPREDSKFESISRLKGAFNRRYGTVTAANSSFLTDGASAVLLMSEKKAKQLGLKPRAYIRSYAHTAQNVMEELLLGPAFAIPKALSKAGIRFRDVGVWEIHEAFAAQMLGVIRSLDSDRFCRDRLGMSGKAGTIAMDKMNAWGGSLSIGHPFGATGGRLVACCCNRLQDTGERFGVVAGCAAGAIGNAIVIENVR